MGDNDRCACSCVNRLKIQRPCESGSKVSQRKHSTEAQGVTQAATEAVERTVFEKFDLVAVDKMSCDSRWQDLSFQASRWRYDIQEHE